MTKTRLWVVSELYYPEQTSTGYFLTRIAEGLARSMPVSVVCGQPTYSEHGQRAPTRENRNGVEIYRVAATHFSKDRLFLRLINMITLTFAMTWFAFRNFRRGDRLLIVTNPPTLPTVVGLIARWRGVDAHLLVHDVYPEVLAATNYLRRGSFVYQLLARFFALTLRLYGSVVVLGRDMADVVREKTKGSSQKISIIPNWGDVDDILPMTRSTNDFAIEHDLVDRFVVQFSGNIGRTHDIDLLVNVARRVADIEKVIFLFVGYGGQAGMVASKGDGNVRYLPRQPRAKLNAMLACSDVTVIAFKPAMKGVSVPSRMYNVMAAAVPILAIADEGAELTLTVVENEAGWHLSPGDADGFEALIRRLANSPGRQESARRGANARAAIEPRYTLTRIIDQYRDLLTDKSPPR